MLDWAKVVKQYKLPEGREQPRVCLADRVRQWVSLGLCFAPITLYWKKTSAQMGLF